MSVEVMRTVRALAGLAALSLFSTAIAIGAAHAGQMKRSGAECPSSLCFSKITAKSPARNQMASAIVR